MLRWFVRPALVAGISIGLVVVDGTCATPIATASSTVRFIPQVSTVKKKKKKRPVVKITAQKGRANGSMNIAGRRSRAQSGNVSWQGESTSEKKLSQTDREAAIDSCVRRADPSLCFGVDDLANAGTLTGPLAQAMAVNLVTEVRLPTPTPNFGPDPDNNEWKMLAVGFPVWLWTDGPTSVSTSASASGFTFRMSARLRSTTFHMGDGSSITCTSMSTYSSAVKPGAPSPDCGHVYTQPSLPKGKYTVRAVADWDVSWSVAGFSGVIPAYNDATATIPIGELVALNR